MPRPATSSAESTSPAPPPALSRHSPFPPLFLWLTLQLIALAIPIFRIPFFATKSFPSTAESMALGVMLTFQIGGAALLFPFLTRDLRTTAMVVAASWPFTVLAGYLASHVDQRKIPAAAVYASFWIISLAIWNKAVRSPRAKGAGVAVAALFALGGPILWYLRGEYAISGGGLDSVAKWGPILGGINVGERNPLDYSPWILMAVQLVFALLAQAASVWASRPKSGDFGPSSAIAPVA